MNLNDLVDEQNLLTLNSVDNVINENESVDEFYLSISEILSKMESIKLISCMENNLENQNMIVKFKEEWKEMKNKVEEYDKEVSEIKCRIDEKIIILEKINLSIKIIEYARKSMKIIRNLKENIITELDIYMTISMYNEIEKILNDSIFINIPKFESQISSLIKCQSEILKYIKSIINENFYNGDSIKDIAYIITNRIEFQNDLLYFFENELLKIDEKFENILEVKMIEKNDDVKMELIKLIEKVNYLDSIILKSDSSFFDFNTINEQCYTFYIKKHIFNHFENVLETNDKNRKKIIEENFVKLYSIIFDIEKIMDFILVEYKLKFSIVSLLREKYEISYMNYLSGKFNAINIELSKNGPEFSIYDKTVNLLDRVKQELELLQSINLEICEQIFKRCIQFIEVICGKYERIRSTDSFCNEINSIGQKSALCSLYLIFIYLFNFLSTYISLYATSANVDILDQFLSKVESIKITLHDIILETVESIIHLPIKLLLFEYHHLSARTKIENYKVSYIIKGAYNTITHWSNLYACLVRKSDDRRIHLIHEILLKFSEGIINATLITRITSLRHIEYLINDHIGIEYIFNQFSVHPEIINRHKEIINFLQCNDRISMVNNFDSIYKPLLIYFIVNNSCKYDLITDIFINIEDFFYWLQLHRVYNDRQLLIKQMLCQNFEDKSVNINHFLDYIK